MRTFWNTKNGLRAIDEWQPNCWVQVTCPTPEDTRFLEDTLGIPDYYISDIADTDERARYDIDEGWILIILRIPYVKETKSRTPYHPAGYHHEGRRAHHRVQLRDQHDD